MEIKGRVIMNLGVTGGTSKAGKEWKKATLIVETEGQYPKKIAMDNMKNAEEFGKLAPGTVGTFQIEVESREFNGRWYTSVNCYKWEAASPYPEQQQAYGQPYAPQGYQQPYGPTGYPQQQGQPYGQQGQVCQPQAPGAQPFNAQYMGQDGTGRLQTALPSNMQGEDSDDLPF